MPSYKNMTPAERAEYMRKRRAAARPVPSGEQQGSPAMLPVDEEGTGPTPAEPTIARKGRTTVGPAITQPSPVHAALPEGTAPKGRVAALEQAVRERDDEIARLKRLLAAASAKDGRPFHPVPKTGHAPEAEASILDRRDASTNTEEHRLAEQKRTREELGEAQRRRDQALRAAFPQKAPRER
jgi:hypothetical protein